MKPLAGFTEKTGNQIPWHNLPLGDVFLRLNSKRDGLNENEAERRLKHFGANNLEPKAQANFVKLLSRHFFKPATVLLILAGGAAFYLELYPDGAFILAAIVFVGLANFLYERRLVRIWADFGKKEVKKTWVSRDGTWQAVEVSHIVPGDVIFLKSGDIIPADGRLASSLNLKVNEHILTGSEQAILKDNASAANKSSIVFGGTAVLTGSGEAVIFDTGWNCLATRRGRLKTPPLNFLPFHSKIFRINKFVIFAFSAAALVLLALGFVLGRGLNAIIFYLAALAAAAGPASLNLAAGVIFETGARRVFQENIFFKNPAGLEKLAYASAILTAKTGILTAGEARLVKVLTPERRSGILELSSSSEYTGNHILVLSYGLMCADAPGPDLVHKAVAEAAYAAGLDSGKLNQNFKKLGQLDFWGERFSVSFRKNRLGEVWLIVMGDPDVLLEHIRKIQVLDRYENAIPFELGMIKDYVNARSKAGYLTVAVGSKKIDRAQIKRHLDLNYIRALLAGLNLTGLLEFKDPPLYHLKVYLALARRAGLHTAVLTGGNSAIARFVAKEVGLWPGNKTAPEIMEGKDISPLSLEELSHRSVSTNIFSRVGTELKLKVVQAFKYSGEFVITVGREASFLREAGVSLALTNAGESARDGADAVFLKNNFLALIKSIHASRAILENFKKAGAYLLSLSLAESALVFSSYIFNLAFPVSLAQILFVNLFIAGLLATSLAGEPGEKEIMELPPVSPAQPTLSVATSLLVGAMGLVGGVSLFLIFIFFKSSFENTAYAVSAVWAALILDSIFMLWNICCLKKPVGLARFGENKYFLVSAGLVLLFLILAVYLPQFQTIFKTEALGAWEWVVILGAGVINFGLIEGLKWILWRKNAKIL